MRTDLLIDFIRVDRNKIGRYFLRVRGKSAIIQTAEQTEYRASYRRRQVYGTRIDADQAFRGFQDREKFRQAGPRAWFPSGTAIPSKRHPLRAL